MLRYTIFTTITILFSVINTEVIAQKVDSLAFVRGVTLLFDSAEDQLTSHDKEQIDSLISNHDRKNTLYRIEGHTDDVGSIAYNTALARRRALSVHRYLTDTKLIDTSNIFTDAYGELKPAKSNFDLDNRKFNRRVDLSIYTQSVLRKISGVVHFDSLDTTTRAQILVQGKNFRDSTFTQANGTWSIFAPDSAFIKLDISAPNYFFSSKRIKVTEVLDTRSVDIELPKLDIGKVYDMPDFYFGGNSPKLLQSSVPALKLLYGTISSSEVCIHIKGHVNHPNAPPVPKSHNYYKLSEARARTVYDYLVQKGIDMKRMKYTGYGNWEMIYPFAQNESAMEKNRRVEIEIIECVE